MDKILRNENDQAKRLKEGSFWIMGTVLSRKEVVVYLAFKKIK